MLACSIGFAQSESDATGVNQGGIGFQVGGASSIGGHMFYNLATDMRLGSHIGFYFDGGDEYRNSTYAILFAPYINYYLAKINSVQFFAQGEFVVNTGSFSEYDPNRAEWVTTTSTTTQFNINAGGEWFPTKSKSISIYGGFNFLNINLNPFRFRVGTGGPFLGINWLIF
jgi:hypothetical protein